MPRRTKNVQRNSRARRSRGSFKDSITISSSSLSGVSLVSGVFTQSLSISTYNSSVADVFELYRIVALKFRLIRSASLTGTMACAYIPGVIDTASAETISGIAVTRPNCVLTTAATDPTPWARVPRKTLQSYFQWYKTIAGTPDPSEEIQGFLVVAGSGSDTAQVQVDITYQLKNQVPAAVTPKMRMEATMLKEKERLLKILSFSPNPSAITKPPLLSSGLSPTPG